MVFLKRLFDIFKGIKLKRSEDLEDYNKIENLDEKPKVKVEEVGNLLILKPTDIKVKSNSRGLQINRIYFYRIDNYDDTKDLIKILRESKGEIFIIDYTILDRKGESELTRVITLLKRFTEGRGLGIGVIKGLNSKIMLIWPKQIRVENLAIRRELPSQLKGE